MSTWDENNEKGDGDKEKSGRKREENSKIICTSAKIVVSLQPKLLIDE